MKAPKAIAIEPAGLNHDGELVVNVKLRRRSLYCLRLLYRSAREHGVGPFTAARISLGVVLAPEARP